MESESIKRANVSNGKHYMGGDNNTYSMDPTKLMGYTN
jgi:hypothetical protein